MWLMIKKLCSALMRRCEKLPCGIKIGCPWRKERCVHIQNIAFEICHWILTGSYYRKLYTSGNKTKVLEKN